MLRRTVLVLVSVAVIAAAGLAGVWVYGQAARPALAQTPAPSTDYNPARIITVLGQGTARVQPNIAQVSIGVETVAATVGEAANENSTQMQALMATLKQQGIPDKDIQTSNYSISLDSSPQPVPQPVGGSTGSGSEQSKPQYRVSNMVTVTIRDLTKVSGVLDAVVEAGANSVWGVSFSLDDPQQKAAEADARSQAIADAQTRAQALAQLGNVNLGPIMSMSEVVNSVVAPVAMRADMAMSGGSTPISTGEVEVTYQAQVVYYIVP